MEIMITDKELAVRKSQGTVYICKSCRDRGKIILLGYDVGKKQEIYFGYCSSCLKNMGECPTCPHG
jgi:hypothetical protein